MHGQDKELQQAGLSGIPIKPSLTDPAITNYDYPHFTGLYT